jgi:hypothetical protein
MKRGCTQTEEDVVLGVLFLVETSRRRCHGRISQATELLLDLVGIHVAMAFFKGQSYTLAGSSSEHPANFPPLCEPLNIFSQEAKPRHLLAIEDWSSFHRIPHERVFPTLQTSSPITPEDEDDYIADSRKPRNVRS